MHDVGGQFCEISSLLPPLCRVQGLNSGQQAFGLVSLLHWTNLLAHIQFQECSRISVAGCSGWRWGSNPSFCGGAAGGGAWHSFPKAPSFVLTCLGHVESILCMDSLWLPLLLPTRKSDLCLKGTGWLDEACLHSLLFADLKINHLAIWSTYTAIGMLDHNIHRPRYWCRKFWSLGVGRHLEILLTAKSLSHTRGTQWGF